MCPEGDPAPARRPLTSWKEIAGYLARGVRTVQEWEKTEGLPVHRHRHRRQSSVYAYPDELDAWWRQHAESVAAAAPDAPAVPPRAGGLRRRWAALVVAAILVAVALVAGSRVARQPPDGAGFPVVSLDGKAGSALHGGHTGDLNGDGVDDVIVSGYAANEAYVLFGGALPPGGGTFPDAANVVLRGGTSSSLLLVTQAGDFNGDGIDDLVVTAPLSEQEAYSRSSSSYIFWGRTRWPKVLAVPADADVTLRVDRAPEASMAGCLVDGSEGDLNGDGIADVWLGAPEYGAGDLKSAGAVFVLFGRRDWPRELEVAGAADVTFRGARMGEGLHASCVLGDFEGRGVPGVAMVANQDRLWNLLGTRGRIYAFGRDGPSWPRLVDAAGVHRLRADGLRRNARIGGLAVGDVNGDGRDDLVASVPHATDDPAYPGQVQIWLGGRQRPSIVTEDAADVRIDGTPGGRLGGSIHVADIDGDGIDDVIAADTARGELHLIYGRRDWAARGRPADYRSVVLLRAAGDSHYWTLGAGDVDGDGLVELTVTSPGADTPAGENSGRAWVLKPYLPIRLEVRPDHDPNPIILPDGLVVARVYGWSAAGEDRIDPASVRLAGALPTRHLARDFDGDGIEDLQLYFQTGAMRVSKDTSRVALLARTRGGRPVAGTDAVVVVMSDAARAVDAGGGR